MGDFSAKLGEGRVKPNDRGDKLVEFCQHHEMIATNNFCKLSPRRLCT